MRHPGPAFQTMLTTDYRRQLRRRRLNGMYRNDRNNVHIYIYLCKDMHEWVCIKEITEMVGEKVGKKKEIYQREKKIRSTWIGQG